MRCVAILPHRIILMPIREPSATVPILRSLRSKMGLSPSLRRFSDRLLVVAIVVGGCATGVADTMADSSLRPKAPFTKDNPAAEQETLERSTQHSNDSSRNTCGRQSLYMFVRLLGHDVPYAEIERNVPVGLKGSSLLELQEAGRRLGIELSIYKCDPTCVESVRDTPCIVLIRAEYRKENGKKVMLQGHYVVTKPVSRVGNAGQVNIIDGSLGYRQQLSDEDFASVWTGYYLTSSPWYSSVCPAWAVAVSVVCFLVLTIWRFHCCHVGRGSRCVLDTSEPHLTRV